MKFIFDIIWLIICGIGFLYFLSFVEKVFKRFENLYLPFNKREDEEE